MTQLTLNTTLSGDVSQSLKYINQLQDDAEELEGLLNDIEGGGYDITLEYKNDEVVVTVKDAA